MKDKYTINDLAEMTGLTTRTLRNYIKLGVLDGEKIEGVWYFDNEDIGDFLSQDMVKATLEAHNNGVVYDFLLDIKVVSDFLEEYQKL